MSKWKQTWLVCPDFERPVGLLGWKGEIYVCCNWKQTGVNAAHVVKSLSELQWRNVLHIWDKRNTSSNCCPIYYLSPRVNFASCSLCCSNNRTSIVISVAASFLKAKLACVAQACQKYVYGHAFSVTQHPLSMCLTFSSLWLYCHYKTGPWPRTSGSVIPVVYCAIICLRLRDSEGSMAAIPFSECEV